MKSRNRHRTRVLVSLLGILAFSLTGCDLFDDLLPTGPEEDQPPSGATTTVPGTGNSVLTPYPNPTTGVVAPEVASPASGSEVTGSRPTLVVNNSESGDSQPLTYTFEVALDEGFDNIVASAFGVEQGRRGRTSWQVSETLETRQYYWRARAKAGFVKSPFSSIAHFTVAQEPEPTPPIFDGEAEIFDPLNNGTSVGQVNGGVFTEQGWRVNHPSDYIRYEVQPLASGFVEFETTGLRRNNPSADQFMLFGMWDPTAGDYRANPFRVHLQKLDRVHNPPAVRLRWIANGEQHDKGWDFIDWDPSQAYQWRLEWGPRGASNEARVYVDGRLVISITYRRPYSPARQWVELGIEERIESIVGTTYSNFQIGSR
jgi:hypothetical protein